MLNRQDVNTTEQIIEEQLADANLSAAENETLQPGQTIEETTAAKQEEQQQYPTDEDGEPLWYEMTEKQFDAAMTELGDDADTFIADKIKEAQKAKKKQKRQNRSQQSLQSAKPNSRPYPPRKLPHKRLMITGRRSRQDGPKMHNPKIWKKLIKNLFLQKKKQVMKGEMVYRKPKLR